MALTFGTGKYLSKTSAAFSSSALTVYGWANQTSAPARSRTLWLLLNGSNYCGMQIASGGSWLAAIVNERAVGSFAVTTGTPFFWAMTVNGTASNGINLYCANAGDAALTTFTPNTAIATVASGGTLSIGDTTFGEEWEGSIGGVVAISAVLTADQLEICRRSYLPPFPTSLYGRWLLPYDTAASNAFDFGGGGINLTATGSPAVDTVGYPLAYGGSVLQCLQALPASAVGSSAGVGAATGVGVALLPAAGSAAGVAGDSVVGASVAGGVGSTAGAGAASGTGSAVSESVASADGVSGGAGVGDTSSIAGAAGSASGTSTAGAVGAAAGEAAGSSSGYGSAAGIGSAHHNSIGSSVGFADAVGAGSATAQAVGSAPGIASAIAVVFALEAGSAIGTATGTSSASAQGRFIVIHASFGRRGVQSVSQQTGGRDATVTTIRTNGEQTDRRSAQGNGNRTAAIQRGRRWG